MLKCSTYLPLFALDLNYVCRLLFKLFDNVTGGGYGGGMSGGYGGSSGGMQIKQIADESYIVLYIVYYHIRVLTIVLTN
jgi:hypothetical protein